MKKALSMTVLACMLFAAHRTEAQVAASVYNVNRNDFGQYDFDSQSKHNRFGRIAFATGLLAGGLALGVVASQQDYYISNTNIYGVGGLLTLVATGLVIGSVNCLNREIRLSLNGNGVGVSVSLASVTSSPYR